MKNFSGNYINVLTSDQKIALDSAVADDHVHTYEKHTVTAGEASSGIITVPTYVTGDDSLRVFLNGMLQCVTDDYAETDTTTITFVADRLTEGDVLILRGIT